MVKNSNNPIDIFDYSDYRTFLSDYYQLKKATNAKFTVRYIADEVGFRSASFFSQVVKGRSNLSEKLMVKFANFLKLNKRQAGYFTAMVRYNQAKTQQMKSHYFDQLSSFREVSTRVVNSHEYEFYQRWYYSAVLDILSFYPFKGNYKELAKLVEPSITTLQAKKAIELLETLNFIRPGKNGVYQLTNQLISAQSEGKSVGLTTYAMQMMERAKESLNRIDKDERSISWVGFSTSPTTFNQIQDEVRNFRKHILSLVEKDKSPSRAWHFNMQMFPVSKEYKKARSKKA